MVQPPDSPPVGPQVNKPGALEKLKKEGLLSASELSVLEKSSTALRKFTGTS